MTLKIKAEVLMTTHGGFGGSASQRVPFTVAEIEIARGVGAGETMPPRPVVFPGLVVCAIR